MIGMICMISSHYSSGSRSTRQGRYVPDLYDLYDLYDLARAAGWELYHRQILYGISYPQVRIYFVDDLDRDLCNVFFKKKRKVTTT